MAWSTPRTWTDGEIVDKEIMDAHVRDQFLALDQHRHSGAAGDGDDELAGVDSITFDDIAAPGAPASANDTVIYAEGGKLKQHANGGSAEELSVVGHTHAVSGLADSGGQTFSEAVSWPTNAAVGTSYATVSGGGDSLAATSADNAIVYTGQAVMIDSGNAGGSTVFCRIIIDGVQAVEHSEAIASGSNAVIGVVYVKASPSTSAVTYALQVKYSSGDTVGVNYNVHSAVSHWAEVTDA